MDYTSEQLNSLISQVEKEFNVELAKAEKLSKLAKSEDFPPKKDEPEKKDEAKASEESKGESKKPMESEKPEDKGVKDQNQQADDKAGESDQKEPGENKEAPKAAEGEGEGHGYDDEDMQHMHSMYSSMSKPELKAHHDCIRKCMDGMAMSEPMAKAEMEDGAKDAEGYRPNGGPKDGKGEAEGKGPKASDAQALEKSEPSIEVSLLKSELEAAKAKAEKSDKELKEVGAFLKKFIEKTAPAGKAITSLDIIAKTEDFQKEKVLSKSEIDSKLLIKAKDMSLSKSDRDAINSYYFSKNIESVRHLLK